MRHLVLQLGHHNSTRESVVSVLSRVKPGQDSESNLLRIARIRPRNFISRVRTLFTPVTCFLGDKFALYWFETDSKGYRGQTNNMSRRLTQHREVYPTLIVLDVFYQHGYSLKEIEALEQIYIKEALVEFGTDYLLNKDIVCARQRARIDVIKKLPPLLFDKKQMLKDVHIMLKGNYLQLNRSVHLFHKRILTKTQVRTRFSAKSPKLKLKAVQKQQLGMCAILNAALLEFGLSSETGPRD